jgi:hypothetical protein
MSPTDMTGAEEAQSASSTRLLLAVLISTVSSRC